MTLQDLMQEAQRLTWQEQVQLANCLLQWVEANMPTQPLKERQPDLHPGVFAMADDFDAALPDSFWLGES